MKIRQPAIMRRFSGFTTVGSANRYQWLLVGLWIALMAGLCLDQFSHIRQMAEEMAANEANAYFNRDFAFRLWATAHGGVYVPVDATTPPNPYLAHIAERDIETPGGRQLTLMNPAYIMRQVYEDYSEGYGAFGRLTSLQPLRPENFPDPWEEQALKKLADGLPEVKEIVQMDGHETLRLLRPLLTLKACLKCHGHQGYKEGDIRGGIDISIPLTAFRQQQHESSQQVLISYSIILTMGLLVIILSFRGLKLRIMEKDLAQKELERYKDQLEDLVLKRTEDLEKSHNTLQQTHAELKMTQARLLQQEKLAAIGQLAAGVAHEINNPLGFTNSNLRTLYKYSTRFTQFMETVENSYGLADVKEVRNLLKTEQSALKLDFIIQDMGDLIQESLIGCDRVRKIVYDLQSFARPDQTGLVLTDINRCLENTINIAGNELKNDTVIARKFGELPLILCYPQQLNLAFLNILANAILAVEEQGGITIETRTAEDTIIISVTDTGVGIAEENLDHIFEPFFTTREIGKGTGLGTSIAYNIIKNHGGDITVASRVGHGTTFTITLPVKGNGEQSSDE